MKKSEVPIQGLTYDQIQVDKIPLAEEYAARDAALIPAAHRSVVINPCRTCMPLGAMFATLGVHRAIPFVQGAQGCTTYVRYTFSRIYKEPATIATASFHEDAAVFGGMKNFVAGIRNLVMRYHPRVVGVVTTCSSEIIGDDMVTFIKMAQQRLTQELGEEQAKEVKLVLINTPSFAGSHVMGYDRASKAFLESLISEKGTSNGKVNLIPGMLSPGDLREVRHLVASMGVESIMLFDTADVFDTPLHPPQTLPYYPPGGTAVDEIADMANSLGTIALSPHEGGAGARFLEKALAIPARLGPLPMGVRQTDRFLEQVGELTGASIPQPLLDERGRLLDFMADTLHYTMMKRVAVFGDPDLAAALTSFVCELGMEPVAVLSGTASNRFAEDVQAAVSGYQADPQIFNGSDLFELEEYLKNHAVDVIIGNSKGVDIAKELGVPLIRTGLMVWDRVGLQKKPVVGYRGGEFLLADLVNALLDSSYPDDRTQQL